MPPPTLPHESSAALATLAPQRLLLGEQHLRQMADQALACAVLEVSPTPGAEKETMSSHSVEAALQALRRGQFVVVADDRDRENEGDLILAAESMSTERLAFLLRHTSGVVCVALTRARCQALELPPMVPQNSESQRTQFLVSVDAAHGTTTGISAADRALTIRELANPQSGPRTFLRPGHVFPLRARAGGVLERRGHTEAAVDLARLAGLRPVAALCELTADDGSMLRGSALEHFAQAHGLPFLHIAELAQYRQQHDPLAPLPAAATSDALLEHYAQPRLQA